MTTKNSSSKGPQGDRVKLTYQPYRSTTAGITCTWLQENTTSNSVKENVGRAIAAFYTPLAYQEHPLADASVLQECIENSLWEMTKQLIRISQTFDSDLSPMVAALLASGQMKNLMTTPMVMTPATPSNVLLNGASSSDAPELSEEEVELAKAAINSGFDAFN